MTASTTPSPTAPNEAMKRLRRRLRESLTPKSAAFAESLIDAALRTERLRGLPPVEWPNCTTHHGCRCREYAVAYVNARIIDGILADDAVAGLSGEEPSDV